jgi:hypothetical protein
VADGNSVKDRRATGNPSCIVKRLLALLLIASARIARAEPCPPAVALTGEEALVGAIRDMLGARGIVQETPRCPAVHAKVERRGTWLVVDIAGPDGVPIERSVTEAATAPR